MLPFDEGAYAELLDEKVAYQAAVNAYIAADPERFPNTIREGWSFYGVTQESIKQGIRMRWIVTKADSEV